MKILKVIVTLMFAIMTLPVMAQTETAKKETKNAKLLLGMPKRYWY